MPFGALPAAAVTLTLRHNTRMSSGTFHIGEVASRTSLSLRTVRYYETVGLVTPSGRTEGGFRLYTESDVQRLLLVRALRPAGLSLEELQEVLTLHDRLARVEPSAEAADGLAARLGALLETVSEHIRLQRERLVSAELAVALLRRSMPRSATEPAEGTEVAV